MKTGIITLVLFFVLVGFLFISDGFQSESGKTLHDLAINLAFTLLGVALTVLVIDRLNERRATAARKEGLIRDLGVGDRSVSLRALNELSNIRAIGDGSLAGADFTGSKFVEADLAGMVADGALFVGSQFIECDLAKASLTKASLNDALFQKCGMDQANLDGVSAIQTTFVECDLRNMSIKNSNLRGASFRDCRMSDDFRESVMELGASVEGAK